MGGASSSQGRQSGAVQRQETEGEAWQHTAGYRACLHAVPFGVCNNPVGQKRKILSSVREERQSNVLVSYRVRN